MTNPSPFLSQQGLLRRRGCQQAAAIGLSLTLPCIARAAGFDEGIDFLQLDKPVPTQTGSRIEVIEFFWFACPHCDHLEAPLNRWVKTLPKQVAFRREHVAFRRDAQQQLFYTLKSLQELDRRASAVFDAIHRGQNPLRSEEAVFQWARDQGLDMASFEKAWRSPGVQSDVQTAQALAMAHAVDSVPRFTVNGRYATSAAMVGGSNDRLFQVLNHLIQKSQKPLKA